MKRRTRPAWRHKPDCSAAHGEDKCRSDMAEIRSSDPRWLPASDRRRLAAAQAQIEATVTASQPQEVFP